MVAPLVGAWIERIEEVVHIMNVEVAPLVGAWIERFQICVFNSYNLVAPLVGAWIESIVLSLNCNVIWSLLL